MLINASIGLNHHDISPDGLRFTCVGYMDDSFNTWSIYVLNISYTFQIVDDRLVMNHRRYGDMRIEPIKDKDEFLFIQGFIKFNRNTAGEVTGFT